MLTRGSPRPSSSSLRRAGWSPTRTGRGSTRASGGSCSPPSSPGAGPGRDQEAIGPMAEQTKKETRPTKPSDGGDAGTANPEVAKKGKKIKEDVDKLLDEIADILEENAQEFVSSYVQRGGEQGAAPPVPLHRRQHPV